MQPTFFCSIADCLGMPKARGLCSSHYHRARRAGLLPDTPGRHSLSSVDLENRVAVCSICGPIAVRIRSGGRSAECMTARRLNRGRGTAASRRRGQMKYKYSLTIEEIAALEAAQDGRCAICRTTSPGQGRAWAVDHDHSCCPGGVTCGDCTRGLLCTACNTMLGRVRDDAGFLRAAANYLDQPPARAVLPRLHQAS